MSVTVSYIEPQQLAELLKTPEKQNTLIVDVRGEDFEGGHIKGALNIGDIAGAGRSCSAYLLLITEHGFFSKDPVDSIRKPASVTKSII